MSRDQPKDKAKLLSKLQIMPIVEVACKQAGVPRSTYYRWRKDDETFATSCDEAIEQSTGFINDMAESQLISAIKVQNMTAIIFWLKHHHIAYETRVKLNATVKHESEELTPDQTALVNKALGFLNGRTDDEE